jgi:hypothetical protein
MSEYYLEKHDVTILHYVLLTLLLVLSFCAAFGLRTEFFVVHVSFRIKNIKIGLNFKARGFYATNKSFVARKHYKYVKSVTT